MLAKVWKKALLVICILACIYNVMNKLISRKPLELQLKSVQNQSSIIDMLDVEKHETNQATDNSSVVEEKTNITDDLKENTTNNSIVVIY